MTARQDMSATLRPLAVLEEIAALGHAPTLSELTARLRTPKPTVHRWIGSLVEIGLVRIAPDGKSYEIGERASDLAFSILSNRQSQTIRHEILQGVARDIGEACNLTILQGTEVVYLDRVESKWPLRISFHAGSRVPAHCSASGKLFLAHMRAAARDITLKKVSFERFTEHTIETRAALDRELTAIRRAGYALDREEYLDGLICIAVPVHRGATRTCCAALAVQAPVTRMSCDDLVARAGELQKAAEAISQTL